jgi:hypothetical protein
VDQDWIERTLMPQLEEVALRAWSVGSLQDFVSELSEQISAARRDGLLTRDGAREARARISEAIRATPGVTTQSGAEGSVPVVVTLRPTERPADQ